MRNKIIFGCLILFLCFQLGCEEKKHNTKILVTKGEASYYFKNQKNILLLSCIKCNCFIDALEHANKQDSNYFKQLFIASDSNCTRLSFTTHHIPQHVMDSLDDNWYNVILLKKEGKDYFTRIISTDESNQLLQITKEFFDK